MFKCAILLALIASIYAGQYTGYQLVRISPKTQAQIDLVGSWQHNTDFDIWNTKSEFIDVLLSPAAFDNYKQQLESHQVAYSIVNRNIQDVMDEEARSIQIQKAYLKAIGQENRIVGTFATYADINTWAAQQAAANSFVTTYSAGKTYEGRDLTVVKIASSNANTARNIWIDCGIHAREWISVSTCVYMIDAFIRERSTTASGVFAKYNIYVMPVHNPDGYAYSFTAGQRLWRKNRRINSGSSCVGVDLNRNFGYYWMVAGASNNPCSDTYAGPTQDSENEAKAVENEINKLRGTWDAFFTIHTYGQFWFTPWGYTSALPADYNDLVAKSNVGVAAIKAVNNLTFRVGSSTNLLYAAAGGSDDWAKGVAGVKYSHCLELRPADTGVDASYGFQLPVDRAPKAGEETYRGILAFLGQTLN